MTRYNQPLIDPMDKLRADVVALVKAALPLAEAEGEFTTEFQARLGDGGWHSVTARQAVSAHQQKIPVRSRRVTPWQVADAPGLSVARELRAAS